MLQVQCTMHAEELFREGSTATYLSTHLFHHEQMGTKYLHLVVGPLVQQLVANPLISKVHQLMIEIYSIEVHNPKMGKEFVSFEFVALFWYVIDF